MAQVLVSDKVVAIIINKELAKKINKNIPKISKAMKPDVQFWVRDQLIKASYSLLGITNTGGPKVSQIDLAAHFGFPAGTEKDHVQPLIDTIVEGVSVTTSRASVDGKKINIGVRIVLYKDNFIEELKKLPTSTISTTNTKGESYELPWVEWLFERGTEIIIADYRIRFVNSESSRSGRAVMIPKGTWSVPSYYAGTKENNWVTKALNPNIGAIGTGSGFLTQRIENIFYRHLKEIL